MKRLRNIVIGAAMLTPGVMAVPAATASAEIPELCVHTGYNYTGSTTCSNGWSNIAIGNYRIHSWSNTTSNRWCLVSNQGTWYAYPGYEPAVDYGSAVFTNAHEC